MESESVIFGKWDNHGNDMNLRISAQNSQKAEEDVELVFKHGNKRVRDIEKSEDLKYIIKYTLLREVDEFTVENAVDAIELFNKHYGYHIDPMAALEGWDLKSKIQENQS